MDPDPHSNTELDPDPGMPIQYRSGSKHSNDLYKTFKNPQQHTYKKISKTQSIVLDWKDAVD
jgi:hypothetical protein